MSIRLATPDDAEQVRDIYAPYCLTPISFELEPPPVEEVRGRLQKVLSHFPWLLYEEAGEVLGYAYAGAHRERAAYRWSVDTSVYIRVGRHRRGVGRALYSILFELLVCQGYVNAYAGVTLPNPGSVGLHEALGFEAVGIYKEVGFKYGAWHDTVWFQRLLQPRPAEPQLPSSMAEMQQTVAWVEIFRRASGFLAGAPG